MSATTQYSNYARFRDVDSQLQQIKKFDNSGNIGQVIGSNGTNGLIWVDGSVVNPSASRFDFNFTIQEVPYTFPTIKIDGGLLLTTLSQFNINTTSNEIIMNCNIKADSLITGIFYSNRTVKPIIVTVNLNEIILNGDFDGDILISLNGFIF